MRTLATAPSVALLTEFDCELINHILFNIGVFFCMLLWRNFSRLPELESLLAGQGEETPVSHEKQDRLHTTWPKCFS